MIQLWLDPIKSTMQQIVIFQCALVVLAIAIAVLVAIIWGTKQIIISVICDVLFLLRLNKQLLLLMMWRSSTEGMFGVKDTTKFAMVKFQVHSVFQSWIMMLLQIQVEQIATPWKLWERVHNTMVRVTESRQQQEQHEEFLEHCFSEESSSFSLPTLAEKKKRV